MNDERYVLARIKADLIEQIAKSEPFSTRRDIYSTVLTTIAKYEAEAILGDVIEVEVK